MDSPIQADLPPAHSKPDRDSVPVDSLCDHCTAKCCRYFALAIDTPKKRADFDFIRWYLLHDRATVFTDSGTWYLLVHTTCEHLLPDHRCGIYATRPEICREYSTKNCEYEDNAVYDHYFETPEQVEEYVEAVFGKADDDIRSRRPDLLPVLA
ncbi:MAG: YkgJ family cysteine cluster protein [Planctomycetes bacterium]|nr:YkgJ family cysteine cluster protein [Planctomycetota bacterium]